MKINVAAVLVASAAVAGQGANAKLFGKEPVACECRVLVGFWIEQVFSPFGVLVLSLSSTSPFSAFSIKDYPSHLHLPRLLPLLPFASFSLSFFIISLLTSRFLVSFLSRPFNLVHRTSQNLVGNPQDPRPYHDRRHPRRRPRQL